MALTVALLHADSIVSLMHGMACPVQELGDDFQIKGTKFSIRPAIGMAQTGPRYPAVKEPAGGDEGGRMPI